jgi:hypothetical protein
MKTGQFRSFVELRTTFPSADQVGKLTVFNIGGGKARLIAAIHYNRQKVYIRAVLTHEDYDKGKWKELTEVKTAERIWPMLAPVVFVPHSEPEYQRFVALLDTLIDVVGEDENHPLASLMEVIGVLIEKYEDDHVPELTAKPGWAE